MAGKTLPFLCDNWGMRWWIGGGLILALVISSWFVVKNQNKEIVSPLGKVWEKPLDKYAIEKLGKREYGSEIFLDEVIATTSAFSVYKFHFDSDGKKVTGLAHVPNSCKKCPVIAQFRGYVERGIYQPGVGTKRSAEVFAKSGFISLAPDGLGYGESDNPGEDVFEERFRTYTTALNLLSAIGDWPVADPDRVGIWGHSNGGQVALTVLEISGKNYPTTVWAPVSKPFPYSILYYTDEAEDHGKAMRKELAKFEQEYDVERYSLANYLERINAALQIHQGTADEAVQFKWNRELTGRLKELGKEVTYFEYPGADHNLTPVWNSVVKRDIEFFNEHW